MRAEDQRAARRYAAGFFQYALQENFLEEAAGWIRDFRILWEENPELGKIFQHPRISWEEKERILERLAGGFSPSFVQFLKLLAKRGRITLFPAVADVFQQRLEEHQGILRGELVVARPLPTDQREAIVKKLEEKTKKRVYLKERVEPEVLGGVAVVLGGKIIDDTLKFHLDTLKKHLLAEALW